MCGGTIISRTAEAAPGSNRLSPPNDRRVSMTLILRCKSTTPQRSLFA